MNHEEDTLRRALESLAQEEADALEDVNRQHLSLPGSKDRIGLYTYRRL